MLENMFRTGFLIRTTHTVLTWVITLILFLHNTDLRRCEEHGELLQPILFSLLVLLSVMLYFTVSLMDPGFVLTDTVKSPQGLSEELEVMIPQSTPRLRRCGYCLLQQPMRARHCQTCKHCVHRFDHHCPWIENCVGERNHRWFIVYLTVQLVALLWALHIALTGISPAATWRAWLGLNGVLAAALGLLGVFSAVAAMLLGCHLYLVSVNATTWEFMSRHIYGTGISPAATWRAWLGLNGVLAAALGLLGVFSAVAAMLLGCHLYLVSVNATTWEFMSRHRVSYLKNAGDDENPFDRGVVCNLWDFFCVCRTVVWEHAYNRNSHTPV